MSKLALLLSVLLITVVCSTGLAAASCVTGRTYSPNVCLFSQSASFQGTQQDNNDVNCQTANANFFGISITGNNADQSRCEAALAFDGAPCIQAYSSYTCSSTCLRCNEPWACQSVCDAVTANCPTANSQGCLVDVRCNQATTNCNDWGADISKFSWQGATTTAVTTTTHAGSTASTTTAATSFGCTMTPTTAFLIVMMGLLAFLIF